MTLREFVTGHGTPLSLIAKEPPRRDVRFALLTALVIAVTLNFAVAIYKLWGVLLANRYFPTPLVILVALAAAQVYFFFKTASERAALQRRAAERDLDPATMEIALRALYRGLFLTSMTAMLLLLAVHELV